MDDFQDALDDLRFLKRLETCKATEPDSKEEWTDDFCLVEFDPQGFVCWTDPVKSEESTFTEKEHKELEKVVLKDCINYEYYS